MKKPKQFIVLGTGANGPLGLNALQCATAVRARQFEPLPTPFLDATGSVVGMGRALSLGDLRGLDRLLALGAPALAETFAGKRPKTPVPLLLGFADGPASLGVDPRALLEGLASRAGIAIDPKASAVVRETHAAFAIAIERAKDLLLEGAKEVIVGAIDSRYGEDALRELASAGRLHTENTDGGRIPSEAAAFVRIAYRVPAAADRGRARILVVEVDPRAPAGGAGRLLRRIPRDADHPPIEWILSDLNGENDRSEDWAHAEAYAQDILGEAHHDEPVQHTGDTGAATGALLFVVGHELGRMGAVRSSSMTVVTHSDQGARSIVHATLPHGGPMQATAGSPEIRRVDAPKKRAANDPATTAQLARVARSCLEDIGSMGMLLAPGPVEPGRDLGDLAQRLLDNFDALVALATDLPGARPPLDVGMLAEKYLHEIEPPDRARRFAAAFVARNLVLAQKGA